MKTAVEKGFIGEDPSAAGSASAAASASAAPSAGAPTKEKKVRVGVLMVVD